MRRVSAAILTLTALALLIGCQESGRVLGPLPPPLVHVPRITAPKPLPPQLPTPPSRSLRGATIVIDPGHGGRDPGRWEDTRSKLPEKTIVLDIARQVTAKLKAQGAKVIMTRTGDTFPSLPARAALAEKNHADLFVSIHANSLPPGKSHIAGVEIYTYTKASKESKKAKHLMHAAFKAHGIPFRGLYDRNYHVLREHSRPAMLIECGYLTNRDEARKLNTASYRSKIATVIADGIVRYFGS